MWDGTGFITINVAFINAVITILSIMIITITIIIEVEVIKVVVYFIIGSYIYSQF